MVTELTAEIVTSLQGVRLVVADMDGTLLDEHSRIPEEFWDLATVLRSRGILFSPASGRQYATLTTMFEPILKGTPIIAENGSYAMIDGVEVHAETLAWETARRAIEVVRADTSARHALIVCGKDGAYTDCRDDFFLGEARKYYAHLGFIDDVADFGQDLLKLAVFDFDDAEANVYPLLAPFKESQHVTVAAPLWVDVMRQGVNKGNALRKIQEHLGITRAETLAFGDFLNDMELIEASGTSFAMANGHPDVMAAATYVAPPNTEHGAITVLRTLFA